MRIEPIQPMIMDFHSGELSLTILQKESFGVSESLSASNTFNSINPLVLTYTFIYKYKHYLHLSSLPCQRFLKIF